ncbi:MAG: CHASE2 domain-containing protein [Phycisphaerae bacterium]|nr:CHASE2 domain-containing protein [Phycisphaerae bacterium]
MTRRQRQANLLAIMVGLLATALVVTLYGVGRLDWLELRTLDYRFRHANSIKQSDDIVCIDIDDGTLELVRRWPWPRYEQTPLIQVPAELGAKAILVDLTWSESEAVAVDPPENVDVTADVFDLTVDQVNVRLSDYELRCGIAEAGNVYLGFLFNQFDVAFDPGFFGAHSVVSALRDGHEDAAREMARAIDGRRHARLAELARWKDEVPQLLPALDLARVVLEIEKDYGVDAADLARLTGLPREQITQHIGDCRLAVLREFVRVAFADQPALRELPVSELFETLYTTISERDAAGDTALKAELAQALRDVLGYEATVRTRIGTTETLGPGAVAADRIYPVYYLHAQVAKRCGSTVFEPDLEDGVTRHLPLLIQHGQHIMPQLAFGLACDEMGVTPRIASVAGDGRARELLLSDLRIQLDEHGGALIPWLPQRDWTEQFTAKLPDPNDPDGAERRSRIPADALWEIYAARARIRDNAALARQRRYQLFTGGLFAEGAQYAGACEQLEALRRAERAAVLQQQDEAAVRCRQQIDAGERELAEFEQQLVASIKDDDWTAAQVAAELQDIASIDALNGRIQKDIGRTLARLRPAIEGKICIVGYTASALADMTPIPTHPRAPGVLAHANLLNGLLTGRTVSWAPLWLNVLIAIALGLLATLVTVALRPREGLLVVLLLAVVYVLLAGGMAFYFWTYWIALVPAVGSAVLSSIAIAFYRYVFVDRERRQLATALGQYTSKEIARQVAENADLCRRAEMRNVTTMFTDLKGFTTISERIGAERTQRVLNICLGRFTDVMLRHEAMVNKFLGDGVFAFWNPVILPQEDHAIRAAETAIDLQTALNELQAEQRSAGGDRVFDDLVMRVGVATGNAVVGPCGSEQKFDYTCIGDSVNVAARLESANKFYGTRIIVNSDMREAFGDRFRCRTLGGVQVKGKRQGVAIFELLGRAGAVPDEVLAHADLFARAVELFQAREWREAAPIFGECIQQRPDDLAAMRYAELCALYVNNPPDEDWNGAIELTEK